MLENHIVLVVDDDDDLRMELVSFLNGYGVKTESAENAQVARDIINSKKVMLVIADIVMPGESGLELTKWIITNKNIPVVLLTSLDDVIDKVIGLELGADDYIAKPFEPRELLARVRSVIRRSKSRIDIKQDDSAVVLYTLYSDGQLFKGSEQTSNLRESDANLLRVLFENEGSVVSREKLYANVLKKDWNPQDRSIDNMIVRLRNLIENDSSNPTIIRTIRQKGYLLVSGKVKIIDA
ncbi:two component transcriptional regulator2C winged helix family [gamma proteobacterium IMCC2047]|nr:two component transcriptional regulator2C winged helix family [gamma proteobacterium IMCC2047]